jgi:hypothetical protein
VIGPGIETGDRVAGTSKSRAAACPSPGATVCAPIAAIRSGSSGGEGFESATGWETGEIDSIEEGGMLVSIVDCVDMACSTLSMEDGIGGCNVESLSGMLFSIVD